MCLLIFVLLCVVLRVHGRFLPLSLAPSWALRLQPEICAVWPSVHVVCMLSVFGSDDGREPLVSALGIRVELIGYR